MRTSLCIVLLFSVVVSVQAEMTPSERALYLAKQTMTADSVEERDQMIAEIQGLDIPEQEIEMAMDLVRRGERNFRLHIEFDVKVREARRLLRLANNADSWAERDRYAQQIEDLDLLSPYDQHFVGRLEMDEWSFTRRVGPRPRVVPPTSQPETVEDPVHTENESDPEQITEQRVDRFVMIVHGWNSGPGNLENPGWPLEMGLTYAHAVNESVEMSDFEREAIGYSLKFDDVEIVVVDWSFIAQARAGLWIEAFDDAKSNAENWGELYARMWLRLPNAGPSKIHLIGHSAGCIFVDTFCRKAALPGRKIQITFLDAYLPDDATDKEKDMGEMAHFAEHFLHRSDRGMSVADSLLNKAVNVDITAYMSMWEDKDFASDHGFPYRWYIKLIEESSNQRPGPMYRVIDSNCPSHTEESLGRGSVVILSK